MGCKQDWVIIEGQVRVVQKWKINIPVLWSLPAFKRLVVILVLVFLLIITKFFGLVKAMYLCLLESCWIFLVPFLNYSQISVSQSGKYFSSGVHPNDSGKGMVVILYAIDSGVLSIYSLKKVNFQEGAEWFSFLKRW